MLNIIINFKNIIGLTIALLSCFVILLFLLKTADLSYPLYDGGDVVFNTALIKGVIENGWYLINPSVGAPFQQEMYDYSMTDNLNFMIIRIFGLFTENHFLVLNLFYLSTYFLSTLTSYLVFRKLNYSIISCIVASILFAFLPYHYLRGEHHLFLAAYFYVPFITMIVLWAFEQNWNKKKYIFTFIVLLMVSSSGIYYAFFTCFFLSVAMVYIFLSTKSIKKLLPSLLIIIIISISSVVNLAPSLMYKASHGTNVEVGKRSPVEAEVYGLKISQLLLPINNHRIEKLSQIKAEYNAKSPLNNENTFASLGMIASLGFLALILIVFSFKDVANLKHLAILNVSALLLASIGGFSSIFSYLILSEIRAYNRISVFIAFFSLLAFLSLLHYFIKQKVILKLISVSILFFGIFDQVPANFNPQSKDFTAALHSIDRFISEIEKEVPSNSMVFQLPYVPFPENPPVHLMRDYDHFQAYLFSKNIRWSYGAMKGRNYDKWMKATSEKSPAELIETLAYAGFSGIYLNRSGYQDNGTSFEKILIEKFNFKYIESEDKKIVFYNIQPFSNELKKQANWKIINDRVLFPIINDWREGFAKNEGNSDTSWIWSDQKSTLNLINTSDHQKNVTIDMSFFSGYPESASLKVTGLVNEFISINNAGTKFTKQITLKSGDNLIHFSTDAKQIQAPTDPRRMFFRIQNFSLNEIIS